MNCDEFRHNWTDWHEGWSARDEAEAMAAHRASCDACAAYDRQMRQLLSQLAALGETPARSRETASAQRPSTRWMALAATLVIGIVIGVVASTQFGSEHGHMSADVVPFEEPGTHRVAIAVDSPNALDEVEFVVELPEGAELIGYPGQREVRWHSDLAAGESRLQLPLRIREGADLGVLVTRIVHHEREQRLEVPLQLRAGGSDDDAA